MKEETVLDREYPKSLHVGGNRTQPEKVVRNADEERAARAEGFKMIDKAHDAEAAARLSPEEPAKADPKSKKVK